MPMTHADPAVQRRRLQTELRTHRQHAGKTQREVADAMDWSPSKVIRIEKGQVSISRNDLRALLDYYGVADARAIQALLDAAKEAGQEGTWADYRGAHDPAFLNYLEFESSAWIIRSYQSDFIPGLLQIEEYSHAMQQAMNPANMHLAERRWAVRERRQKLHEYDKPPKMFFLFDESILWRPVGGPGVQRRQLERLRELNDEAHVSIQVLPFDLGPYPSMGTPFVHLEFQNPADDDLLYLERQGPSTTTRSDPEQANIYLEHFFKQEALALSTGETNDLVESVIERLKEDAPQAQPKTKSS